MRRSPLYDDVTIGRGGLAGGRFVMDSDTEAFDYIVSTGTTQNIFVSLGPLGFSLVGVTLDAADSSVDDAYNGMTIEITSGADAGVFLLITDYTGSTRFAAATGSLSTYVDYIYGYRIINRNH